MFCVLTITEYRAKISVPVKMHLSPPPPRWLRLLVIIAVNVCVGSVFGPCFVIYNFVSNSFCNHIDGEERAYTKLRCFKCLLDIL